MLDRITVLKEFLKEEPDDAFTLYALALEYIKIDDLAAADRLFSHLMEMHADYLPAYYHAGKLKEALGKNEEARLLYRKGVKLAESKKDLHTLNELKTALDEE